MKYPVFLISLAKDTARRNALKERFSSYDKFSLIDAVDGREMNVCKYFSYANASLKAYHRLLSPAEIGCALSHVVAYEAFLASGAEFGLIFEDDIIGDDSGINLAFKIAEQIYKNDKNIVFICGAQDGLAGRFSAFGKKNLSGFLSDIDAKIWRIAPSSHGCIYRAAAYIITRESAKGLLNLHKKALCTTDVWEFLLRKINANMYFSDIFAHPTDLSSSNIENERNERGYKPSLKAYFKSFKFLVISRLQSLFLGYERIFKGR
ncbi:glycosyltransferase family 25 protein [Campylobacter sp. faydin G-140]|uniref:glycosyltransferase family 25 protein n=1 Tax=Campylobacter anatolicus TaxID=2829105 RepID=UPI001B8EAE3B|nr:glycosyltransferase family 25 protein [Campylobacter anatolicus]MBR8465211.1 glycosyltransferase family 25 protein [Campylobacter anatolicus]